MPPLHLLGVGLSPTLIACGIFTMIRKCRLRPVSTAQADKPVASVTVTEILPISCLISSCLVWSRHSPCLALSGHCLESPHLVLPCLALLCLALPCLISSCLVWSRRSSCLALSGPVPYCLELPHLFISCRRPPCLTCLSLVLLNVCCPSHVVRDARRVCKQKYHTAKGGANRV